MRFRKSIYDSYFIVLDYLHQTFSEKILFKIDFLLVLKVDEWIELAPKQPWFEIMRYFLWEFLK